VEGKFFLSLFLVSSVDQVSRARITLVFYKMEIKSVIVFPRQNLRDENYFSHSLAIGQLGLNKEINRWVDRFSFKKGTLIACE